MTTRGSEAATAAGSMRATDNASRGKAMVQTMGDRCRGRKMAVRWVTGPKVELLTQHRERVAPREVEHGCRWVDRPANLEDTTKILTALSEDRQSSKDCIRRRDSQAESPMKQTKLKPDLEQWAPVWAPGEITKMLTA